MAGYPPPASVNMRGAMGPHGFSVCVVYVEWRRQAVDTFLHYHYQQGLSKRLLTCEDIFVPDLLRT